MTVTKNKIISFTIALIYVGLGTLWVLTSFGTDRYYIDWPTFIILEMPVAVISMGIRFYVRENYLIPVIVIQFIMFFITYFLIQLILNRKIMK